MGAVVWVGVPSRPCVAVNVGRIPGVTVERMTVSEGASVSKGVGGIVDGCTRGAAGAHAASVRTKIERPNRDFMVPPTQEC